MQGYKRKEKTVCRFLVFDETSGYNSSEREAVILSEGCRSVAVIRAGSLVRGLFEVFGRFGLALFRGKTQDIRENNASPSGDAYF